MSYHIFLTTLDHLKLCVERGVYGGIYLTGSRKSKQMNSNGEQKEKARPAAKWVSYERGKVKATQRVSPEAALTESAILDADRDLYLRERIARLKQEREALILAHNYQLGEVQDVADFVGDSLELSQIAAKTDAKVIVFCGVQFMAETAAILSPNKIVLLPDIDAGCLLADMITAQSLREKRQELPKAYVVCYVNSPASVKAESNVCCTSANALKVVEKLGSSDEILFVPDQYLGHYASSQSGKKLILWPGFCPTHVRISPEDILRQKEQYPKAKVIVHPECKPEVIHLADEVLSTGGMCRLVGKIEAEEIIVATEVGIIHRLSKKNPQKHFIPASLEAICPYMKLITLEHILHSLEEMKYQIKVPEEISLKAKSALDKMLEFS